MVLAHGRRQRRCRRRSLTATAVAAGLLLAAPVGCTSEGDGDGGTSPAGTGTARPSTSPSTAPPEEEPDTWVADRLAEMSLEEKIGQLFVVSVYGETAGTRRAADVSRNETLLGVANGREAVERYDLGGIIYFDTSGNLDDPAQVAGLSNGLQRASLNQPPRVPLLISTDQEHGIITRLGAPATRFPGSMALGASGREADARQAARISGQELRAVGINMDHAPDADVNVNPANPVIGVRSFSSDPTLAARLTAAQVEGYQSGTGRDEGEGVVANAKHFPGHGDTDVDSHTGLPEITHSLAEWEETDAPPFRAAIEAGTGSIMVGHLRFPELDPSGDPATLSRPIITGLLREELGYQGVVITDSLMMAGVRETYPDAEVPVRALRAGADLLLMPPDLEVAHQAVLDAVAAGELTEARIDQSVRRILTLKRERGIAEHPYAAPSRVADVVGSSEHETAAQEITDRTTTLVKNDDGVLPLAANGQSILVTGAGQSTTAELAERIGSREVTVTSRATDEDPVSDEIAEVVAEAQNHDTIVVATSGTRVHPRQATLVDALIDTGLPVVTISTDVPYDIAAYPDAATHLATYSQVPVALESATRVLFGETSPQGTLPVTIPSAADPGQPLFPLGHGLSY
jgi:beta-N-acetylhexosaminidase